MRERPHVADRQTGTNAPREPPAGPEEPLVERVRHDEDARRNAATRSASAGVETITPSAVARDTRRRRATRRRGTAPTARRGGGRGGCRPARRRRGFPGAGNGRARGRTRPAAFRTARACAAPRREGRIGHRFRRPVGQLDRVCKGRVGKRAEQPDVRAAIRNLRPVEAMEDVDPTLRAKRTSRMPAAARSGVWSPASAIPERRGAAAAHPSRAARGRQYSPRGTTCRRRAR